MCFGLCLPQSQPLLFPNPLLLTLDTLIARLLLLQQFLPAVSPLSLGLLSRLRIACGLRLLLALDLLPHVALAPHSRLQPGLEQLLADRIDDNRRRRFRDEPYSVRPLLGGRSAVAGDPSTEVSRKEKRGRAGAQTAHHRLFLESGADGGSGRRRFPPKHGIAKNPGNGFGNVRPEKPTDAETAGSRSCNTKSRPVSPAFEETADAALSHCRETDPHFRVIVCDRAFVRKSEFEGTRTVWYFQSADSALKLCNFSCFSIDRIRARNDNAAGVRGF
jgi:hypothetical protein